MSDRMGMDMVFEIAGFVSGVAGIGVAFWLLYQHDSSHVMRDINGQRGPKLRA